MTYEQIYRARNELTKLLLAVHVRCYRQQPAQPDHALVEMMEGSLLRLKSLLPDATNAGAYSNVRSMGSW